jgi:F420-dependent oxidoreductase-like protein
MLAAVGEVWIARHMSISLGVHVGQQNMAMADMRALWRKLDAAGVDWISAWDHFYEAPPKGGTEPHYEALATLGALAAETSNARIGCLVFYVGYRNPALLAKAATTLDHISGGRFELGLGAGWHIWEATAYGYPFPDIGTRLDMLEEAVQIVRRMLTEERTSFSGIHFQVDDASCLPHPIQKRLPIWIGGVGEKRTLKIVADHADGWNAAYLSPAEFARVNEVLNEWCEAEGRDPRSLKRAANVMFHIGLNEKDLERQRAQLAADWGPAAERTAQGALLCTPENAVERIMEYVNAGADEVNIALRAPWLPEALDAYLNDVLPGVRRAAASA